MASAASRLWQFTPASATDCEVGMSDPLIALGVAVALAAYLIYALIHPEKF
ncbi:MAG: K(+)-transporting ATPase subunit F [Hyphomicrobium sp.]|nr:MAG: K(+)-transporting ATPase subunit F [Hyphomicrobium sp.]